VGWSTELILKEKCPDSTSTVFTMYFCYGTVELENDDRQISEETENGHNIS
jgi:hypothetical protein